MQTQNDTFITTISKSNTSFFKRYIPFYTLILVTLILFIRKPDQFLHPQFMYEDGPIFFTQSVLFGIHSLVISYAGYLHVIIRLIAYISSFFPYTIIPAIYTYTTYFLTIFVCSQFFSNRLNLPYKPLFALAVVATPNIGEVYMCLTNIQWMVALLPLLVFLKSPPTNSWQKTGDLLIILLVGLTGPFVILLWPLFFIKYIVKKSSHNLQLLLLATLTTSVQLYFLHHATTDIIAAQHILFDRRWLQIFGIHFFADMYLIGLGSAIGISMNTYLMAALAILSILLTYLLCEFRKERMFLITIFYYYALAFSLSVAYKIGYPSNPYYLIGYAGRYYFLPHLMLSLGLITCLAAKSKVLRGITVLMLIFSTWSAIILLHFLPPNVDFHWKEYAKLLEQGKQVVIPVNPPGRYIDLTNPKT